MAKVETTFTAKNKQFLNSIKQMESKLGGFGKNVLSIGKTIAKGFAVASVAVVGIGAAFFAGLSKALDYADAIGKTAQRIGVTTKLLQEFRFAMDLNGASMTKSDNILEKLQKNIGELKVGTGALTTFLKKYDESLIKTFQDTENLEEGIHLLLEVMEKETDTAKQTSLAFAAAGKSGTILNNALKEGRIGFIKLMDSAEGAGVIIRDKFIKRAEDAKDEMTVLSTVLRVQLTEAFIILAPELEKVVGFFRDNVDVITELIDRYAAWSGQISLLSLAGLNNELADLKNGLKDLESAGFGKSSMSFMGELLSNQLSGGKSLDDMIADQKARIKVIEEAIIKEIALEENRAERLNEIRRKNEADRKKAAKAAVDAKVLSDLQAWGKKLDREQKAAAKKAADDVRKAIELKEETIDQTREETAVIQRLVEARRISEQAYEDQLVIEQALLMAKRAGIEVGSAEHGTIIANAQAQAFYREQLEELTEAERKAADQKRINLELDKKRTETITNMTEELELVQLLVNARQESEEAYEAELQAQEALQKVKQAGFAVDDKDYARVKRMAVQIINLKDRLEELGEAAKDIRDPIKEALEAMKVGVDDLADFWKKRFSEMTDALVDFVKTGKLDFKGLINSLTEDILRFYIQAALFGEQSGGIFGGGLLSSLGTGLRSIFSEKGNAFSNGNVIPFGKGGVMSQPFSFPMSNGRTGIGAESGPEAILPLQRNARGELGVLGGSQNITNVYITMDGSTIEMTGASTREIGEAMSVLQRANNIKILGAMSNA